MAAAPPAVVAPSLRKAPASKSASSADDRAFVSAKSLYDAGRYADALPRFEALSGTNTEADLYAARCIAKTRGCAAAEARYDAAARTNAGTETGSRAQLEGARCYQSTGDVVAARRRYQAAKDEGVLEVEASKALDDLDHTGGGAGAAGGAHAAPKAAAPREMAPEPAPASPPAKR
jgi:thioredoxin-like negative regulator of GroEL